MIIFRHPARAKIKRMQVILFLQVNAQYPSRLTKLTTIKRFLGRFRPCDCLFFPKNKK